MQINKAKIKGCIPVTKVNKIKVKFSTPSPSEYAGSLYENYPLNDLVLSNQIKKYSFTKKYYHKYW